MKTILFGVSACLAVAVLTMAQVPVAIMPGSANLVRAIDGTAAAPSVSFAASPTTGMYNGGGFPVFSVSGNPRLAVGTTVLTVTSGMTIGWASSSTDASGGTQDTSLSRIAAGEFGWTAVAFASLGTPASGTFAYCSDCTIANPCASGGSGALAKRLNGAWVCN